MRLHVSYNLREKLGSKLFFLIKLWRQSTLFFFYFLIFFLLI
jgi:hypothetical protein